MWFFQKSNNKIEDIIGMNKVKGGDNNGLKDQLCWKIFELRYYSEVKFRWSLIREWGSMYVEIIEEFMNVQLWVISNVLIGKGCQLFSFCCAHSGECFYGTLIVKNDKKYIF